MKIPRVFICSKPIEPSTLIPLEREQVHYLNTVLRLGPGKQVLVSDGRGGEWLGTIVEGPLGLSVRVEEPRPRGDEEGQRPNIHLILALLKSDRTELAIQKVTELGVTKVSVVLCERSIPRNIIERLPRFQRVAKEAARQCGRTTIPEVFVFSALEDALRAMGHGPQHRYLLDEEHHGAPPLPGLLLDQNPFEVAVAVGPEGSFTERERHLLLEASFQRASLGPRILRAETAAIAAVVVVQCLIGDMGPLTQIGG